MSSKIKKQKYLNVHFNIGSNLLKPHNFCPKEIMASVFFSFIYTSIGPLRVHNPEYQPPVTSGSRVYSGL